jgi:hypothetical protein
VNRGSAIFEGTRRRGEKFKARLGGRCPLLLAGGRALTIGEVPQHRSVLCKSEEAERERLVIDRETNVASPQFGVRIADDDKFKYSFKFGR